VCCVLRARRALAAAAGIRVCMVSVIARASAICVGVAMLKRNGKFRGDVTWDVRGVDIGGGSGLAEYGAAA
jgi:hypothetical protein